MSRHFDIDLAEGKAREDAFARVLLAGREKFEHKRDRECSRTGNVALEYETSEAPNGQGKVWESGPLTAKDTHWLALEYADDHRLLIPLETAVRLARVAVKAGHHKWIGDNRRFHCALVPLKWFLALPSVEVPSKEALEKVTESWTTVLPTLKQSKDHAQTGEFTPDAAGWTA